MQNHKAAIESSLLKMREENMQLIAGLTDRISIGEYSGLLRIVDGKQVWTDALQRALDEHEIVVIPAADEPYFIDGSVRIPSNRRIEAADGAVMRILDGITLLMMRNEHTMDGTHMPIPDEGADFNISIDGGRWEEYHTKRGGYGKSGLYDPERSFFGVSTCLLFNHLERLTLTNMTFAHCAGFGVQVGNVKNAVFENIVFDCCYADGVHINGSSENVLVRNISGEVGDDLVALNTYDWQNSSVTWGVGKNILCENLDAAPSCPYKSMRMEPGIYTYDDGTEVDCALIDVILRNVRGVMTFKLYFQTPRYEIGTAPEAGRPGTASHIYFENVDIDLTGPVDRIGQYMTHDPVRGVFAAFELGSNIDYISFENIRLTLHRDDYPMSCLMTIGPKSIREGQYEIFDPFISNHVQRIDLRGVTINGEIMDNPDDYIHVTSFDDVNGDGHSTGSGSVDEIVYIR